MLLFVTPWLAEAVLRANDFQTLTRNAPTPEDAARWRHNLGRTGRLCAGLAWHRANVTPATLGQRLPPVTVPTLGLYSDKTVVLAEDQMIGSVACVDAPWRYVRLAGVGHWLQIEAAEAVDRELIAWFGVDPRTGPPSLVEVWLSRVDLPYVLSTALGPLSRGSRALPHAPKRGIQRRNVLMFAPIAFGFVANGKAKADDPRLDRRWRCGASECPGYVYDPRQGESTQDIPANTAFHDVPADFWCPECGAGKIEFFRVGDGVQWRTGLPD